MNASNAAVAPSVHETSFVIANLNCDGCESCGNCTSNRIKMNLLSVEGVEKVYINHKKDEIRIAHSAPVNLQGIERILDEMGYPVVHY